MSEEIEYREDNRIFSRVYAIGSQNNFRTALKEGDLEKALEILRSILPSNNPHEVIDYLVTVNDGQSAIIKEYQRRETQIKELGSLDEVKKKLAELESLKQSIMDSFYSK